MDSAFDLGGCQARSLETVFWLVCLPEKSRILPAVVERAPMASLGPSSLHSGVFLTRRGASEAPAGALNISTLRPGICNVDGSRPSLKKR